MKLRSHTSISLAATGYSPWIDLQGLDNIAIQLDCGDVASPVGVVTVEGSNDFDVIERERDIGTASASSAAIVIDITSLVTVQGTAFATGFDGVGNKAAIARLVVSGTIPAFIRFKYTRTSGGAGDTLHFRAVGRG